MTFPSLPEAAAPPHAARSPGLLLLVAVALASTAAAAAGEAAFSSGAITVERPWSRATPGGAAVAAGYLTIRNAADAPDRLVSATTAAAGRAGPHRMAMTNGVMAMRPLPEGVLIPPHGTAVLAPGGDHLMLEDLKQPLRTGECFAGTLVFERAGPIPVTFTVESIGAKAPTGAAPQPDAAMKMN